MSATFSARSESDHDADRIVVWLAGELDMAAVRESEEAFASAFEAGPKTLVADLGALAYLDSSGLRVLNNVRGLAEEKGVELALRHVPPVVRRLLEITALTDRFVIEE